MAEFVQTMRDWQRMCDTIKSCDDCPLQKEDGWTYILCSEGGISAVRPEIAEKVIAKWAAKHPEPKYPTWWKYLCMIGVIPDELGDKTLGEMTVYRLMNTYMQSDTAQKLGVDREESV